MAENLIFDVRLAREDDYQSIIDILNAAIAERRYTALLTPVSIVGRAEWFRAHQDGIHPIYVAEDKTSGQVIGWMAVNAYRSGREAFAKSCEISYYIAPDFRGHGVGTALMDRVIAESRSRGLKNLMAVIFADNQGSLKLARAHGFEPWGRFPGIVEIDGRQTDCYQMGLKL